MTKKQPDVLAHFQSLRKLMEELLDLVRTDFESETKALRDKIATPSVRTKEKQSQEEEEEAATHTLVAKAFHEALDSETVPTARVDQAILNALKKIPRLTARCREPAKRAWAWLEENGHGNDANPVDLVSAADVLAVGHGIRIEDAPKRDLEKIKGHFEVSTDERARIYQARETLESLGELQRYGIMFQLAIERAGSVEKRKPTTSQEVRDVFDANKGICFWEELAREASIDPKTLRRRRENADPDDPIAGIDDEMKERKALRSAAQRLNKVRGRGDDDGESIDQSIRVL